MFTLGAEAESRRHRLLPERWGSAEVALRRHCLERVLAAGREAGCRIEVSSPQAPERLGASEDPGIHDLRGIHHRPQQDGSFGNRLDCALSHALRQAHGPVAVVGTDVPGLSARHLREAFEALGDDPDRVAIGPSPDGGFYLLAARRPIEGLGSAVAWCCGATLETLLDALAAAGRPVVLLEPLADLDRPADLDRWLAQAPQDPTWRPVVAALLRLLARLRRPWLRLELPALPAGFTVAAPSRGPPALPAVC